MKTETYKIWKEEEYSYEHAFGFVPKITSYLHEDEIKRPCILVAPGGGYCGISPAEGELVALKFYNKGYQAFVLTYTTNLLHTAPLKLQPLKDISRAVRYIRKHSNKYNVDEEQIVLCGFSAGGHLCGSLCVHYSDISDDEKEFANISNRPDAAILCYPVIVSGEKTHRDTIDCLLGRDASDSEMEYMSLEKHVTEHTPPVFIWATATDELVPVENSELFAKACREKEVSCAFHMFSEGKHGLSLADEDWANGVHRNPYTQEQTMYVFEKLQKGEVAIPEEVMAMFSEVQKQLENQPDKANYEVAIWPELADMFLKETLKK